MIVNAGYRGKVGAAVPKFTYTGQYNQRDDGVVELLTSGTLVFLNPAVIDVFCVGGGASGSYRISGEPTRMGGGGGGGGYTATKKRLSVNGSITVTIGDGGPGTSGPNKAGGATSFGNFLTANGGNGQTWATENGTSGGSGGGGGASSSTGGTGGSNGEAGKAASGTGGSGQNSTTREFGETTGKLYAGGGGGGSFISGVTPVISAGGAGGGGNGAWCGTSYGNTRSATSGVANTGGGGGGGAYHGSFYAAAGGGGSGIVCFRAAK